MVLPKSVAILAGILIILTIVSGCVKPPSLRDEFQKKEAVPQSEPPQPEKQAEPAAKPQAPSPEPSKNESVPKPEEKKSSSSSEPKAKDLLTGTQNYASIKTIGESSSIDAQFFAKQEAFTVPYTDLDAIIFDIAKKFGVTLNEVRLVLIVDGNPYLRPSQKEELKAALPEEEKSQALVNENSAKAFANISYAFVRPDGEEGFIRAIGCDLSQGLIRYKLFNWKEVVVKRYREIKPKLKDPLTTYFNGKRIEGSYCEDVLDIEPNQTVNCYHSGVVFVRSVHSGPIEDESRYTSDLVDRISVTQPGYNEEFKFICGSNSTNSSS